MLQRVNSSIVLPLWLILMSSLSVAAAAVDIRFLRSSTNKSPTQMSGWRSKRLTAMACHCCSNSFNSHCCLQCVRVGKRGSTIDEIQTHFRGQQLNTRPFGQHSWSDGDVFSKGFPDTSEAAAPRREVWESSPAKRQEPMERSGSRYISMWSLLDRSRACARCLKSMRSGFVGEDEDILTCCEKCKGSEALGDLRFGYKF